MSTFSLIFRFPEATTSGLFFVLTPDPMTSPPTSLDSLRREIDAIDDQMHDLLMRRTAVVERIGALKNQDAATVYIRPEREATMLRRLVKRHRGRFPAPVVVRIWREMLAATSRLQGPFSVAVYAPERSVGYWDLARDHYGSCTRMDLHAKASPAIRAVTEGTATVAVLPLPEDGEDDPWWPLVIAAGDPIPRIAARLPFIENSARQRLGALAIARMNQEQSGDDVSLLAVEADPELSRGNLETAFAAAGLPASDVAVWRQGGDDGTCLHLIEVADFVGRDDARTAAVKAELGERIGRVIELGGYARPLGGSDG